MIESQISESLEEFFALGKDEAYHPYLTEKSRPWGKNISLRASILSACFLLTSFILSFYTPLLSAFFLTFVFFLSGTPALINTFEHLSHLKINISVLMTVAAFLSIAIGSGIEGGLLLVLFALSESMEEMVARKTKSAISSLRKLTPTIAHVIQPDGSTFQKSVKEIGVDTEILVRTGEVAPLDGVIVEGKCSVGMMHLTGESNPVTREEGEEIQAGCILVDGTLRIKVTKTSKDSTIARIISLIIEAGAKRPKVQQFLDRFGEIYSTTIIILTFCFIILLPLIFGIPYTGIEGSVYRSLAFLIAASPCALIIAIPTAYLSAISACARKGILLKGGLSLDALAHCRAMVFDKTGTLTTGNLDCVSVEEKVIDGTAPCTLDEAIAIAASLETAVKHPIAFALNDYAQSKKIPLLQTESLTPIPGSGIEGTVHLNGKKLFCQIGNLSYIQSAFEASHHPLVQSVKDELFKEGHVIALLKVESTLYLFNFLDHIRDNIKPLMQTLHTQAGYELVMLTGDNPNNAQFVANQLSIDTYHANLKPEDKLALVEKISSEKPVAMVGDGINDAPAMAYAHVAIAMGEVGTGTAIDAADIVLLRDDLQEIAWLIRKSKKTLRIVKENLTLALGVILLATTPALLGYIPLWLAVILHEGGTVIVGLNSLRLLRR